MAVRSDQTDNNLPAIYVLIDVKERITNTNNVGNQQIKYTPDDTGLGTGQNTTTGRFNTPPRRSDSKYSRKVGLDSQQSARR